MRSEVLIADARDVQHPHARDRDRAAAIHDGAEVDVHAAPRADVQLISGADYIIRCDRNVLDRGKRGGHVLEQVTSEDRQDAPGGGEEEVLKFVSFFRRGELRRRAELLWAESGYRWLGARRTVGHARLRHLCAAVRDRRYAELLWPLLVRAR